jgi:hypothetical protein
MGTSLTLAEKPDFAKEVFPLLMDKCGSCHSADNVEANLRLDSKFLAFQGGTSGKAVLPGKAESSLLLRRIKGLDDQEQMPLDDEPLSAAEIAIIKSWIDSGASWPDDVGSSDTALETHWAFEPPVRPALPTVKQTDWPKNEIDFFILNRLEKAGLTPSTEASKGKLLRRLSFDLTGLPPTPEDFAEFINDTRPGAYERAVDRLLASPHYGERWARPWLDLARYADSNGYQADQYRSVWPYRDWVIHALNADMPFDQFTIEQIAGDLLPGATIKQKVASGLHRLTTCNVEAGVDPEENRSNQVIDRVNTTATIWLGVTLECAQCHNHKYDPFTQRDYYSLYAYFNNTPLEVEGNGVQYNFVGPKMDLPPDLFLADQQSHPLQAKLDQRRQHQQKIRTELLQKQTDWEEKITAKDARETVWEVAHPNKFTSKGAANGKILPDGSVLVSGKRPDKDTYVIDFSFSGEIKAVKLDALTHEDLPGKGPGRHTETNPNFVLNQMTLEVKDDSGIWKEISLTAAQADFSQARYPVAGAVDNDPKTAWAINPEFHEHHWATFLCAGGSTGDKPAAYRLTLEQNHGETRTLGRPRISVSRQAGLDVIPKSLASAAQKPFDERNGTKLSQLKELYLSLQPSYVEATAAVSTLERLVGKKTEGPTSLVMIEDTPRTTHIFKRGDFRNPADEVQAATPRILHECDDLPPNRLGLARWLTDKKNPLVARVTVNRWWAEIFGQGLVRTSEDFGTQGDLPTHPQLLDYLACEFMDRGWSMKYVHRKIVTSAMYRQSSHVNAKLLEIDPENKLYTRGPRIRLSAEQIRDNGLALSGLFSSTLGGEPLYPPQPNGIWRHVGRNEPKYLTSQHGDRYRRGLYTYWRRSAPYPAFTTFDAPDRASCTVKRSRTNTPLQALTLLNDEAVIELTSALAARILAEAPKPEMESSLSPQKRQKILDAARMNWVIENCLFRTPNPVEVNYLTDLLSKKRAELMADKKKAASLPQPPPAASDLKVDAAEFGAWFYVANVLMNLDETITKD